MAPQAVAQQISLGGGHSCAIMQDGSTKCWGLNSSGQLGLDDTEFRGDEASEMGTNLPSVILSSANTVIGGREHTCAILNTDDLKCWGQNYYGKLGMGHTESVGDGLDADGNPTDEMGENLPPVDLGTGRTAVSGDASFGHTCAVLDDGSLKCWGRNVGQLGLGDTQNRGDEADEMGDHLSSVDLGSGRTATQVVTGQNHTCALLDNGSVKCWGENHSGQLGLGDTQTRGDGQNSNGDPTDEMGDNLPTVDLGTGRTATDLAAGTSHTCALLDDDSLKCWGGNFNGQLGLDDTEDRGDAPGEMGDNLSAVDLGTGRTATAVVAGDRFTCARLDDDSVKCWGSNPYGQLGLGDEEPRGDGEDSDGNPTDEMGDNLPAVDLGGISATQIGSGAYHVCAVLEDGSVKCWGRNDLGMLGLEDTDHRGDETNEMGSNLSTVSLDGEALPVELTSFTGRQVDAGVRLRWSTASETNNAGFRIEHRTRGGTTPEWAPIGHVEGAGTTTAPQTYRFHTDRLPVGTHHFRLKQIDTDGAVDYSDPVDVKVTIADVYRLVAPSPNPASGSAHLRLTVQQAQSVRVTVYDLLGREVETAFDRTLSPQNEQTIRIGEALPSGTYVVQIDGTHFTTTERWTVAK